MTSDQAHLYVAYVPGIVGDLLAVLDTHWGQESRVKPNLMASVRTLQGLMLEANAALEPARVREEES